MSTDAQVTGKLPRVAITFCTQCRWMLRAAYFGQELLSTFSTSIGEIALIPATGGIFQVHLTYREVPDDGPAEIREVLLWDRKTEGGFPETKVLKQLLRDHIEPKKDLGHSDRHGKKNAAIETDPATDSNTSSTNAGGVNTIDIAADEGGPGGSGKNNAAQAACEDCK